MDNIVVPTIELFFFLIPGFTVSLFLNSLLFRKKGFTQLDKIFEALVFTVIILAIYHGTQFFLYEAICPATADIPEECKMPDLSLVPVTAEQNSVTKSIDFIFDTPRLIYLFVITLSVSFLTVSAYKKEVFLKGLRKDGYTNKSASHNAWLYANTRTNENNIEYDLHCTVELEDGRKIQGAVGFFPETEQDTGLFLEDPLLIALSSEHDLEKPIQLLPKTDFLPEDISENIKVDGLLLDVKKDVKSVLFWKVPRNAFVK